MARISDLPDDILCIVVSFLSAKSAAYTAILSKKWLNLFTMNLITIELDLVFDQSINNGVNLEKFVDGLLNRPASHLIRRFSLKLQSLDKSQFKLVNDCLCNVLKRGIMGLEVDINVKEEDDYLLPDEVFTCKTIEKLKLGSGFAIYMIPRNALLPALKTLILDTVSFDDLGSDCVFQRLLSACPVIDELVIDGFHWEQWKWSRSVSSQTLKRLILRRKETDFEDFSESDTLSFDTPSVTHLEYSNFLLYDYPIMFFHDFDIYVPVFENLIHVSITTESEDYCWHGLRVMLENSPKLEALTIEGRLHYFDGRNWESVCECLREYSFLLTCPIKVLKITEFKGDVGEMVQLKHVVKKLLHLEVLELHVEARDDEKVEIIKDMRMIPRVSRLNCVGSWIHIGLRSVG